jgi:hypothetical protein
MNPKSLLFQQINEILSQNNQNTLIDASPENSDKITALESLYFTRPSIRNTNDFSVIKVTNLPLDVTIDELVQAFAPLKVLNDSLDHHWTLFSIIYRVCSCYNVTNYWSYNREMLH